ncbi:MAG TPA: hypothetical protein VH575_07855 [Gemmataceae bacterium]|jgi:hypothetical protein
MEAKNNIIVECDQLIEFDYDASQQNEPLPPPPALSDEEKAFAQAITRLQCKRWRALLTWREIFEVVQALGYRKVEASAEPPASPQANGSSQDSVPADGARAEMPS